MRILHAPMQIAGAPHLLKREMPDHDVRVVDLYPSFLDYPADRKVAIMASDDAQTASWRIAIEELARMPDVAHFWFGASMAPGWNDIALAKAIGARTIMHHCGSDVRTVAGARAFSPWARPKPCDEEQQKRSLAAMSRYVDDCLVTESRLMEFVAPYYGRVRHVPFVVDCDSFPVTPEPERERPLVVHAPTSRLFKGTDYILAALDEVRRRGVSFDVDIVEGVPHEEAKVRFRSASVVIDQVCDGGIGAFAGECMSMGRAVVAYACPAFLNGLPEPPPFESADPTRLAATIERLLLEPERRDALGEAAAAWVRRWHDVKVVAKTTIDIYEGRVDHLRSMVSLWRNGETGEVLYARQ